MIRYLLGALLTFGAISAFAGGYYGLSGAKGVPPEWLANSPFIDYFIPSLILLVVVGGVFSFAAIAVFMRFRRGLGYCRQTARRQRTLTDAPTRVPAEREVSRASAARKPALQSLALTVAGRSTAIFIALVLSQGGTFLVNQAGIAVLGDAIWVIVFAAQLFTTRRSTETRVATTLEQV